MLLQCQFDKIDPTSLSDQLNRESGPYFPVLWFLKLSIYLHFQKNNSKVVGPELGMCHTALGPTVIRIGTDPPKTCQAFEKSQEYPTSSSASLFFAQISVMMRGELYVLNNT